MPGIVHGCHTRGIRKRGILAAVRMNGSCSGRGVGHSRRLRGLAVLASGGALCASLTTPARASGSDPVTADALFREGRRAADSGHYTVACARFEQSNKLDPAPGTLLNLADCQENLGQLTRAWRSFRELYDELPASDPRRAIAETRASALERRMPKLRILLVSQVPATVTRDDAVVPGSELGVLAVVDPGRHTIVVTSPGRQDRRYEITTADGQDVELTVSPSPAPPNAALAPVPTPPPPVDTPRAPPSAPEPASPGTAGASDPARKAAIGIGAVGVASLLTGTTLGIVALTQLGSSNASCSGNVCASQSAVDEYNSARSFALAADISLGVGIACLGTAIVMELIHPRAVSGSASGWPPLQAGITF